jgi:hypothetical protein
MTPEMLTGLLITFGPKAFSLAEELIRLWDNKAPLTLEDINRMRKLGERTPIEALTERLKALGVPLDSDKAKELISLLQ